MGGLLAGGLLTSIAGSFIGSSIAHSFFDQPDVINNFYESNPDMAGGNDANNDVASNSDNVGGGSFADQGDSGGLLASNDSAGQDFGSAFDGGGDLGDFGGDF